MNTVVKQDILLESGNGEVEILIFKINGEDFGVNVSKVREIITTNYHITPVPNSDRRVIGIFSPRDECINAIDLKKCLFSNQLSDSVIDNNIDFVKIHGDKNFIICHFNGVTQGWLVDTVCNIIRVPWSSIVAPAGIVSSDNAYITGVYNDNGHIVQIIDFESIMVDICPSIGFSVKHNGVLNSDKDDIKNENLTVFIADDSKMLNKLITQSLLDVGYKVVSYVNGNDLFNALIDLKDNESKYPDIIITDLEMPVLDGLTLCRMIKEHHSFCHIPVLIFSSLIDDAMIRKCESVHANGAFSKPEISQVIDFIHQAISDEKLKLN